VERYILLTARWRICLRAFDDRPLANNFMP